MLIRCAIIEDGVVVNLVSADPDFADEQGWIEAPDAVDIGWTHDGDSFAAPVVQLDDARAIATEAVNARRDACFRAGFTPASGPLAGKTLQVRDVEDRTNWLTSQAAYAAAVAQGGGALQEATFRTESNETITVTYLEGLTALLAMAAWGKAIFGNSWALKDAIAAAADQAALDTIDIEAGWP